MRKRDPAQSDLEMNEPLIDQKAENYNALEESFDPLIKSLPVELKPFLKNPDNSADVEFMSRSGAGDFCHTLAAVILNLYSLCKMVLVKEGQIGLTWNGGTPEILPPGRHVLLSPMNYVQAVVPERQAVIQHGPINIIRVGIGQLGFGIETNTGEPVLLKTGKHVINSSTFEWRGFISCTAPKTQLGNLWLIRVETGQVGYGYEGGNLVILEPGLHLVSPPNRFENFMSTQLDILELPRAIHESSDYVPLAIHAAVFYRVADPYKALTRIKDVKIQIRDTAISTLAGIIRSSSLADIARGNSKPTYAPNNETHDKGPQVGEPSAPPFYERVHDEFMQKLANHVLDEWGIEIQNIRIEALKIADVNLQTTISHQAIMISKQQSEYIMLQKKTEIIEVKAENSAMQIRKNAEAEAHASISRAEAAARAQIIQAKAENESIILRAEAEKRSKILKGEGEAEYSESVAKTKLGQTLAVLNVQRDAISGSKQIMYVPHLPGMMQKSSGIFDSKLMMPGLDQ